jgi:hypothetical protein
MNRMRMYSVRVAEIKTMRIMALNVTKLASSKTSLSLFGVNVDFGIQKTWAKQLGFMQSLELKLMLEQSKQN